MKTPAISPNARLAVHAVLAELLDGRPHGDCWTVMARVLLAMGVRVPPRPVLDAGSLATPVAIADARHGDVVVMARDGLQHVGVIVDVAGLKVVHGGQGCAKHLSVAPVRLDRWDALRRSGCVVGIYRPDAVSTQAIRRMA